MKFQKLCRDVRWFLGSRRNPGAVRPEKSQSPHPGLAEWRDKDGARSSSWFAECCSEFLRFLLLAEEAADRIHDSLRVLPPRNLRSQVLPQTLTQAAAQHAFDVGNEFGI